MNKIKRVCFTYKNNCVIGAYEGVFYQRFSYLYSALTDVSGYFIRKEAFLELLDEAPEIARPFKRNLLMKYILKIKVKMSAKMD